jgi:hypothetical protein
MVGKTLMRTLCCVLVLLLGCGMLMAQSRPKSFHVNPNPNRVITPTPRSDSAAAQVTFFSNLGPTPDNNYYSLNGWVVAGPSDVTFGEQWVGMPFIPKQTGHVRQIKVPIGWIEGTNKFVVGLYSDNGAGTVGTLMKQAVLQNAPTFGDCCTLMTANMGNPGVAITAGTQYWVVANHHPTALDFGGAWAWTNLLQAFSIADGTDWTTYNIGDFGLGNSAMSVSGTVP